MNREELFQELKKIEESADENGNVGEDEARRYEFISENLLEGEKDREVRKLTEYLAELLIAISDDGYRQTRL